MNVNDYTQGSTKISERGKRRLRIAARFLRKEGYRFNSENFYEAVLAAIRTQNEDKRLALQEQIDWLEEYEIAEMIHWVNPYAPASGKANPRLAKKARCAKRLPARTNF